MKPYYITTILALFFFCFTAKASDDVPVNVPDSVFVGGEMMHVQGFAVDAAKGCMYFSFTSRFLKTDLKGNILGSIDRIQGHLGAMTLNPENGKVYASLECKDDEIGAGIARKLNVNLVSESVFYIAVIDVDKLDHIGCDPEKDPVMTTVYLSDPCEDYAATVHGDVKHAYGCSGIDGVTFAPAPGKKKGNYLYVGYGVYSDTSRQDNDYQVLLKYDISKWTQWETPVKFGQIHTNGPAKADGRYYVYTGNTSYGIQNMAYDSYTNRVYLAVYKGRKEQFPNWSLFAVDWSVKPHKSTLKGVDYAPKSSRCLQLAKDGRYEKGIYGWNFKWGSTGLCSLGGGYWMFAHSSRDRETGLQSCNACLYRWSADPVTPFGRIIR